MLHHALFLQSAQVRLTQNFGMRDTMYQPSNVGTRPGIVVIPGQCRRRNAAEMRANALLVDRRARRAEQCRLATQPTEPKQTTVNSQMFFATRAPRSAVILQANSACSSKWFPFTARK